MDADLTGGLAPAGRAVEAVSFSDGTRLLVLPSGGRVLGLFAPGDARNFYWVNPALLGVATARDFFGSSRWQNLGGERTWLGPELDFFYPRYPDLAEYRPPDPFDRNIFEVARDEGLIRLSTAFSVKSRRANALLELRLTKTVGPAANPLRHDRAYSRLRSLRFAGYSLRTTLDFVKKPATPVSAGIWNLTQLPHGGEMIIPAYGVPDPAVFFGAVPAGCLRVQGSLVRYRMDSPGDHKIGLPSFNTTGRIGYLLRTDGTADLVVKNIFGNPSGEYPDAPSSGPSEKGYGVEACNVMNESLGAFSELEYHTPAVGETEFQVDDRSQAWGYRGDPEEIGAVAEMLLGLPRASAWL